MKNALLGFIIISVLLLIGYSIFLLYNPLIKTEIEYRKGEPDTVIVRDTVYLPEYKFKTIFDTTTIIDSSGRINYDSIRTLWCDYKLEADTLLGVIGKVRLNRSMFEFDSTFIYYPKITIKQIDTIAITKTIGLSEPFYKDTWFWTTLGLAVGLLIK